MLWPASSTAWCTAGGPAARSARFPAAAEPAGPAGVLRPGSVMATFCHYVLYFTSPATAAQWTAAHPGTFVISLEEAAELARRHAARIFADALRVLSRFAL